MTLLNEKFLSGIVIGYLSGQAAARGDDIFAIGFAIIIGLWIITSVMDSYKKYLKRKLIKEKRKPLLENIDARESWYRDVEIEEKEKADAGQSETPSESAD